jgi:hypothetical protein
MRNLIVFYLLALAASGYSQTTGTNSPTVPTQGKLNATVAYSETPERKTNSTTVAAFKYDSIQTDDQKGSRYSISETPFTFHRGNNGTRYGGALLQVSKQRKFNPLHLVNPFAPPEYGNAGAPPSGNRIFHNEHEFPETVVLLSISK